MAYSDAEWSAIRHEAKRVCKGDPDEVPVERHPGAGTYVTLRSEVERISRKYCQPPPRPPTSIELRKRLEAKRRRAAASGRALVEQGGLRPSLREQVRDTFAKVDRFYANRLKRLPEDISQSALNAAKRHLDEYFEELQDPWIQIGGRLRGGRSKLITFLQACARPVIGNESTSLGAIDKRLRRFGY